MMLSIKHLDVNLQLRDYILGSRHLSAELLIEHTRSDIPPGILLWDINLGVNIYPTPYDSVGYARGTLYTS